MTSRDAILDSLRRNRPAPAELPVLDEQWTTYANPRAKFIEMIEAVGGKAIVSKGIAELNEQLRKVPQVATAKKIASLVPGIGESNVDAAAADSPHALADVDVAILSGEFGVAENGAVWVTDRNLPQRVLYFLCQHLILVIPTRAILDNMHAAYARIESTQNGQPPFDKPLFGVFISGPSKTADIEQQLVVGAHGPRSLTVCLLDAGVP
jgi:L-lactate dehydrogenase complex protein LldG